jgi:hypothetical protein
VASVRVSDAHFIASWRQLGSSGRVARALGMNDAAVRRRRRRIETRDGITLETKPEHAERMGHSTVEPRRHITVRDGLVVVCSDLHIQPGRVSVAHQALCRFLYANKVEAVIANGDLPDFAQIGRHDPLGWQRVPRLDDELVAVKERMGEIGAAAVHRNRKAKRLRTLGNHCARFDRMLRMRVGEFEGVPGFSLNEHLPDWPCSLSVWINDNVIVKHRWHGGVHATWNNALKSGKNIVTGHVHRLQATILSDYNGPRWGIDTGTLADVNDEAFSYAEDNPVNWCSGFVVLSFRGGRLLHPEFAAVIGGVCYFRGQPI